MGKNKQKTSNKSKKDDKDDGATKNDLKTKNSTRLSLEALDDMSNSDEGSLPPENEWNDDAKRLRDSIMSGKFDHLLEREDGDASSVEEVELGDDEVDEDSEEESGDDVQEDVDASSDNDPEAKKKAGNRLVQNEASSSDDEEEEDSDNEAEKKSIPKDSKADNSDSQEENERVDSSEDEGNEEILNKTMDQKNQISSKALHVVTEELAAQKAGWSWAETFDVVPQTKLPFDKKANTEEHIDIHDDLKREVTFYDLALEAANEARLKCEEHGISFSRPDDFFAEMVKTDDHMAKIKDRLIFESKKIEAVSMRKSNKEQKLRVKESQANRAAEKSKRKRDHFKSLEDWQSSGNRNDSALMDALEGKRSNKKRMIADKKYGFGGQKPRFKQNDKKDLNDSSGFNPRGNFPGGMKRGSKQGKGGSGGGGGNAGHRPGKRARDAKRSTRK